MKCFEAFVAPSGLQPKSKQILFLTAACKQTAAILAADTCKCLVRICISESFRGLEQDEKDHNILLADFVKICCKIYSNLAANCYEGT